MAYGKKTGGRKKGTPNKHTRHIRELIRASLERAGGEEYLARMAEENPAAFLGLVGRLVPVEVAGDKDAPLQIVTRAE